MRSSAAAAILFIALATPLIAAPPPTVAASVPWHQNLTLIELSPSVSLTETIHAIEDRGAQVAIALPPDELIARVSPALLQSLREVKGVTLVTQQPVEEVGTKTALAARRYLNSVLSGTMAAEISKIKGTFEDGVGQPDSAHRSGRGPMTPSADPELDMRGIMGVNVFLAESDGRKDPNLYSWTPNEISDTQSRVIDGLSWWTSMYYRTTGYNRGCTFSIRFHTPLNEPSIVNQPYEPITHGPTDDQWVREITKNLGYDTPYPYNLWYNSANGLSSSFCIFIAYSGGGAPNYFQGTPYVGYATLGGSYMIVVGIQYIPSELAATVSHETGHIYHACDEYGGGCSCAACNPSTPWMLNSNCKAHYCTYHTWDCIMEGKYAYSTYSVCPYTKEALGWINRVCFTDVPDSDWKGEYFNDNPYSHWLYSPVLTRDDGTGPLNFDWGYGGPGTGDCPVQSDYFSVQWTRWVSFPGGNVEFTVTADDGVRMYIDNVLKIDHLTDGPARTYIQTFAVTAGTHSIRLQYYEATGLAKAALSWRTVN